MEVRTVTRDAEMKVPFETLTESTSKLTTVDETVQTVQEQVLSLTERVTNVEKVRKVEKIGQVTHRRADAFDNRLGQLEKRVVVLTRDVDSKIQQLQEIQNTESGEYSQIVWTNLSQKRKRGGKQKSRRRQRDSRRDQINYEMMHGATKVKRNCPQKHEKRKGTG
jgi:hypothetical protein